jgi:hypothetical protein
MLSRILCLRTCVRSALTRVWLYAHLQGVVPQSGDGGVGVALISYCDQVILSVLSDEGQLATTTGSSGQTVVPLEDAFFDEVQRLKDLAQAKIAAGTPTKPHQEDKKRQ